MAAGDVKLVLPASGTLTLTAASLASDTNLLVGRQSAQFDNTSTLYEDVLVGARITTGTTPTVGYIELWGVPILDDTVWPDAFSTADAARTAVSREQLYSYAALIGAQVNTTTSNQGYWFRPVSMRRIFGGTLPGKFVVWLVHSTVAALNATGGNHAIYTKGVYRNVAAA